MKPDEKDTLPEQVPFQFHIRNLNKLIKIKVPEWHIAAFKNIIREHQLSYPVIEKLQTVYKITQDKAKLDFENRQSTSKPKKNDYPAYRVDIFADPRQGAVVSIPSTDRKNKNHPKAQAKEKPSSEELEVIITTNEKNRSITLKTKNENPSSFHLLQSLLQSFLKEQNINSQVVIIPQTE